MLSFLIIGGDLNVDFSRPSSNRDNLSILMASFDLVAADVCADPDNRVHL